jgi:hypothetical protein
MLDRLADLHRQRALVQEHLDWIDREIIRAERQQQAAAPAVPPAEPALPAAVPPPAIPPPAAPLPVNPAAVTTPPHLSPADAILEEYRVPSNTLKSDVRKGCLLYFAGAFVLLGLAIVGLWLAFRR